MNLRVKKVAVIGAGVMGSGIASHLANAGIPVVLLDIVPPKSGPGDDITSRRFRDSFARGALEKMQKMKPAPLMTNRALDYIRPGNLTDDFGLLADCDWIVEAIREDVKLKQELFTRLEAEGPKKAIITSNTSGLRISEMMQGRGAEFRRRFFVTHFFNPVRYMKLLELVPGVDTPPELLTDFAAWASRTLGKGVVFGKDTPNFVGNRIGVYGMMRTMQLMAEHEVSIEEVDAIFGPAMGRPGSAVFRTGDLVGLDTFVDVTSHCHRALVDDPDRETFKPPAWLLAMVEKKLIGDKSGSGFYRKVKGTGKSDVEVIDLATLTYRPKNKVRYESLGEARDIENVGERIRAVFSGNDKAARFARAVTVDLLAYSARLLGEIADDIVNIDRAIEWGFGWKLGPFKTWDAIGVERVIAAMAEFKREVPAWVKSMLERGQKSFYAVEGVADTYWNALQSRRLPVPNDPRRITIEGLRRARKPLLENDSATVHDMGDRVLLLEFHTKMNSVDSNITESIERVCDLASREGWRGIVIGNDGEHFSAGANIGMLLWGAKEKQWDAIRGQVRGFQAANQRLRYGDVPVVTAPFGYVFGGGCEIAMMGHGQQAAAESYVGLVEVGVGLIPGGGGNLAYLRNLFGAHAGSKGFDPFPFVRKAFMTIGTAFVATSGESAREECFLAPDTGISMNRDDLLADAKARVLGLADAGYRAPRPTKFFLPGKSGAATVDMMLYDMMLNHQISEYDRHIGRKLAHVITGGDASPNDTVSEQELLDLELEAFLSLCGEEKTQDRLQHMLEKGKPLRN